MAYQEPGNVMTQSGAAEYLRNKSRYKTAYQNIENQLSTNLGIIEDEFRAGQQNLAVGYGQDRFSVGSDFSQNMAQAFQSAAASRTNLLESNVGQGFREQGFSDLERMTTAAYDSYVQNYAANRRNLDEQLAQNQATLENTRAQGIQAVTETAAEASAQIDEILANEASNYAALYNAPRQYLQYLTDEGIINQDDPNFGKFFDVTYEEGSPVYNLKSGDTLDSLFYNYENGEIVGLSDAGIDFYNQILYGSGDLSTSFGDWLYGTNEELYNWANAGSAYGSGTNLEDVFTQIGLGDVVKTGKYTGDTTNAYSTNGTTYENSKDFGTVTQYTTKSGKLLSDMSGLTLSGANFDDIGNDKSESFTAYYVDESGTKRKYDMKIDKNAAKASDDVITDISKAIGGKFENHRLYVYGDKTYLSEVSDGKVVLREVNVVGEDDAFYHTLKNANELSKNNQPDEFAEKANSDLMGNLTEGYVNKGDNPLQAIIGGGKALIDLISGQHKIYR